MAGRPPEGGPFVPRNGERQGQPWHQALAQEEPGRWGQLVAFGVELHVNMPSEDDERRRQGPDAEASAMLGRGWTGVIESEADIGRPPEDVFDYCSDHAHETEWNVKMTGVRRLDDAPIGVGARYRMEFVTGPPMTSECVRFERPHVWEMVGESRALRSAWRGRIGPRADGSHLTLRMEIQLRGVLRLATPFLRRRMQPELDRDIARIKARLEGEPDVPHWFAVLGERRRHDR
jgi:uncharacterized protein YndB with AHSA1/START domain